MDIASIMIVLIIALLAAAAIIYIVRNKNSCSGCDGDCSVCAGKDKKTDNKKRKNN